MVVVSYQIMSVFVKMRDAFLAPILPRVIREGESKEGSSHCDQYLNLIGPYYDILILCP